jgi:DNA polymerase-3 subunit delta'
VGQERQISQLLAAAARPVHAYLLVGPAGTGKRECATGFAAALLCPETASTGSPDGTCDVCRRVLARVHPDVVRVEREGAFISIDTAREVSRIAATSPVEGERKVVVLEDFHLVRDTGPALLKTIEEPPPATVFVILAEYIPPELVTIASRCVQVELTPLSHDQVASALKSLGAEPETATRVALASAGSLDRARLLLADGGFEARRRAWAEVPTRLDGTGATAAALADELVALLESSVGPLQSRQALEAAALAEHNRRAAEVVASGPSRGGGRARGRSSTGAGTRRSPSGGAGAKELEERHRREQRRQRTDELRYGLAILAGAYRDWMASAPDARRQAAAIAAIEEVDRTARSLEYNPGELLALQALLARLGRLHSRD